MPILAKTDDKKPTPEIKTTVSMAKQTAAETEAVTGQVAGRMSQFAAATPQIVNDLTHFWRDLAKAQVAHNSDAFRQLAAARNWQDYFDLQTSYVSGNVTRMSDAAFRYASMTGAMMSRLVTTSGR